MIMRYHWGLAVGHIYVHDVSTMTTAISVEQDDRAETDDDIGNVQMEDVDETMDSADDSGSASQSEDWDSENGSGDEDNVDDDEFLARYEMYGDSQDVDYYE
jgi:hypothetical protein